jgi:hypothetical protein
MQRWCENEQITVKIDNIYLRTVFKDGSIEFAINFALNRKIIKIIEFMFRNYYF